MTIRTVAFISFALLLAGCVETVTRGTTARILTMGDSMLAWNSASRRAVSDVLEENLGQPVIDRSVVGARYLYRLPISGAAGMNIAKQYRDGDWDWVVLNGGGNDLLFGCGCLKCDKTMSRLISYDGQLGEIPNLIFRLRRTGARVIYVGYLHSPGAASMIDHCKDESIEFERRIAKLAQEEDGIYYLRTADMVPFGDLSLHAVDRIHPSVKGSAEIGRAIARIMND